MAGKKGAPKKHWPYIETEMIADEAFEPAERGDQVACWSTSVRLLRAHMEHMVPGSTRWNRAYHTIKNIEAQIRESGAVDTEAA